MIALFSATGNSRLVAQAIAPLTGNEPIVPVLTLTTPMVTGQDRIIWIFPVHAWGVPGVVEDVIRRLRFDPATEQYLIVTCGDDIGHTDRIWRRLIAASGGTTAGAFSIHMPNTYVLLPGMDTDTPAREKAKLTDAPARIRYIAGAINSHSTATDVTPGSLATFKSHVIRPFFRRFLMSPKPFHADTRLCTRCGACVSSCPLGNITIRDGVPQWGDRCATCLACYHACRRHAVCYGTRTRAKGQYHAPSSLPRSVEARK